jgi:hypothetical protein
MTASGVRWATAGGVTPMQSGLMGLTYLGCDASQSAIPALFSVARQPRARTVSFSSPC